MSVLLPRHPQSAVVSRRSGSDQGRRFLCGSNAALRRTRAHPSSARAQAQAVSTAPAGAPRPKVLSSEDVSGGECEVFVDNEGEVMEVLCCDYGFRSGFGRLYQGGDGEIPKNFFSLGGDNFRKEFKQLRRSFRFNEYEEIGESNPARSPITKAFYWVAGKAVRGLAAVDRKLEDLKILTKLDTRALPDEVTDDEGNMTSECDTVRAELRQLKLENAPVWKREEERRALPGAPHAPWPIRAAYISLCWVLDIIYDQRPIQRFWFLEVVARMPYFSYISMLHLYESLGWWRAGAELRRIHFAEEWNELHHLQIMESLGGDSLWIDRFMAQHAAVFYYWVLLLFFAFSPSLAYIFSELVEGHAVDTYAEFVEENADRLKSLPPPLVALEYYKSGDLYFFDKLQTNPTDPKRRPNCRNLYDVFCNIRDDEKEHVKTMKACRDYSIVTELAQGKKTAVRPVSEGPGKDVDGVSPKSAKAADGSAQVKVMDDYKLD